MSIRTQCSDSHRCSSSGEEYRVQITVAPGGDFYPPEELITAFRSQVAERAPQARVNVISSDTWNEGELSGTEVFMGWPSEAMLAAMPKLRWVQLPSAGADGFVGKPGFPDHVALTTASGVFGIAGAEHALALLLATARKVREHVSRTVERRWGKHEASVEIFESTIAVFGLGDIGMETARRLSCLGARVIGVKRTPSDSVPEWLSELKTIDSASDIVARCDAVVLVMPGTEETKGMFDAAMIGRMKEGSILVNVGRGSAVDQRALVDALESGHLFGAGLDVTDPEPLPADDPLWAAPNLIIASHSMNIFDRKDERRFSLLLENVQRFVDGKTLSNLVDHTRGY